MALAALARRSGRITRGACPFSSARNWPQAAAMATPRDQRTVVGVLLSLRIAAKRAMALFDGGWNGPAAVGLQGIRLTRQ